MFGQRNAEILLVLTVKTMKQYSTFPEFSRLVDTLD